MTLATILRFLHVLAGAGWLGTALFWPGALKRALAAGAPHPEPALRLARTGLGLDLGLGLALVAAGLLYASPLGQRVPRAGIWIGLVLAVARVALALLLARPALQRAGEAALAGRLDEARAAARPVSAYAGVAHLIWLLALACMVFPV
jgi:hypothetical protein